MPGRWLAATALAIGLMSPRAWAQSGLMPPPQAPQLTADDLHAWLDPFIRDQLARLDIAGAVVVVFSDDTVVLSQGYGVADVQSGRPMTDDVLVRPGSISKLVTAIAVLQLVEAGRLDLDRDVNEYTDFRVPTPAGGMPVTLRLLLTHRAGFENHLRNLFARDRTPEPLDQWLRRELPARLFPYGDVPAYSNYGYALAGGVVARMAQTRFEDYAAAHIFQPLGMVRSTFEQPPPRAWSALVSRGYRRGTAPALPYFEVVPPSPAGGLSTTGADMGRFVRALLDGGAGLLRPETFRLTRAPMAVPGVPGDPAWLGFEETHAAGNRFVGKHGLTDVVVSDLELLPESRFGLFVSYNSRTALGGASTQLLQAFAQRYFRRDVVPAAPLATAPADAASVAGAYQISQREDTSVLRLLALLQQTFVVPRSDGRLGLSAARLVETAPLVFEGANDRRLTFHRRSRDGTMTMRDSAMPLAMEWERVPRYLDRRLVLPLVGASVIVAAATLILWPVAAFVRRRRRLRFGAAARDRREYLCVRLVLALNLLVTAAVIAGLVRVSSDTTQFNTLAPWLAGLYVLAWLSVGAAPVAAWISIRFWRDRVGMLPARVHHTLIAAAILIFAWFCLTWRLAGTTFNY